MDRSQKADAVAQLNAVFNEVAVVVVTRNLGMTVAQSTDLRGKMRDAGATYKVAKNRLAKLALENTDYVGLGDMLTGPVGLAWSTDPVAAAKAAVDFAKSNDKLEIVGGSMGSVVLDEAGIKRLPRCRASTRCAPSSSDWSTPRRRRSLRSSRPPLPRSPVFSPLTRTRPPKRRFSPDETICWGNLAPPQCERELSWPILPSLLKSSRS